MQPHAGCEQVRDGGRCRDIAETWIAASISAARAGTASRSFQYRGVSGLRPAEMLAAIERDHLAGHRRRFQDEAHRRRDLARGWCRAATASLRQRSRNCARGSGAGSAASGRARSPLTRMRGASASAIVWVRVHSPRLADRVGHEIRRQIPHPLIEQVDHDAAGIGGQQRREILDQHERRPQIDRQMRVPALARRGRDRIVLENRGVVDQHADRPERRRRVRQQALRPRLRRQDRR